MLNQRDRETEMRVVGGGGEKESDGGKMGEMEGREAEGWREEGQGRDRDGGKEKKESDRNQG